MFASAVVKRLGVTCRAVWIAGRRTNILRSLYRDKNPSIMDTEQNTRREPITLASERVFKFWDYPAFILISIFGIAAILYFYSHWFLFHDDWANHPFFYAILGLSISASLLNNQGRWFLLPMMRRPYPVAAKAGWKVGVATTVVQDAEPLELLEKSLRVLVALDYPHDTWVLDEGDDDEVRALCQRLGAQHFSRKKHQQYQSDSGTFQSRSKHGNYNAWLHQIGFQRYDIITLFDPDHVADPGFLSEVLGYFEDPKIGYVQAAQAFSNQKSSLIARGAAEESYEYYSSIQMINHRAGYPTIIGSHNTHRVSALKEVGGLAPHDADDLLLTLSYQSHGWRGVYVPKILARGLAPVGLHAYLTQQRRWARSVLDIKFRRYPELSRHLSPAARFIGVFHGLHYIYGGLIPFIGLTLILYLLIARTTPQAMSVTLVTPLAALCGVLQLCEFYRQRFYLDPRNEGGLRWRAFLLKLAKWPYFLLAVYEVVCGRVVPYVVTHKVKAEPGGRLMFWPHFSVAVTVGVTWMIRMLSGDLLQAAVVHILAAGIVIGSCIFSVGGTL